MIHGIVKAKELGDKLIVAKDDGIVKAKELSAQMDENVKAKPYHYIAGCSLIALLLGLLIGGKRK